MPRWHLSSFFLFFTLLFSHSGLAETQIEKPELDLRDYRHITLENGLEVLLVHDDELTVAGAALTVPLGGDDDPEDIPGLVHLLEHMLFSGSEKYPDRGGFTDYISSAGGSYNAYTAADHTNFFFQVGADRLEEGLSRFSDFIIAPSLEPDAVADEIAIVQSEFDGRRDQLGWRMQNVLRQQVNPDHPASRMAMGNRESFEGVSHENLVERLDLYHGLYFTPGKMKLVVMGPQPMEQLREWAERSFAPAESGEDDAATASGAEVPLLEHDGLPARARLQTVGDTDVLKLSFEAEPEHLFYQTKPYTFLGRVLSSKKSGRLAAALKERGWIDELSTGMDLQGADYATFSVRMTLTEEGVKAGDRIIASIFDYLDTMSESEDLAALYEEQSRQAQEEFRFPRKGQVMQEVSGLAVSLLRYPVEEVLTAPALMSSFDEKLVRSILKDMTPDQALVTHAGDFGDLPDVEPVTGIDYEAVSPDDDTLTRWKDSDSGVNAKLAIRENPFTDDEKVVHPLADNTAELPVNLSDSRGLEIWHLQDKEFREPRGVLTIAIESPMIEQNLKDASTNLLYSFMLAEELTELMQTGSDAGIQFMVNRMNQGVGLSVQGFTGKQEDFLQQVADAIHNLEVTPKLLRKTRAKARVQVDGLENAQYFEQMMTALNNRLRPGVNGPREELAELGGLGVEDMKAFHRQFWKAPEVMMMALGNYREKHARALADIFTSTLEIEPTPLGERFPAAERSGPVEQRVGWVPAGVAARYYPVDGDRRDVMAATMLTTQMLHNRIFQQFRDSQQWGYVAFATLLQGYEEWGTTLMLQAPDMKPGKLDEEIAAVLDRYRKELPDLTEESFDQYRDGIRQALGARRQNLQGYASYWWSTLRETGEPVDRAGEVEEALDAMTVDSFRRLSRTLIADDAPMLALLSSDPEPEPN
ncbi:insulinase family protein [Marinobacter sp. HL-58]|uniref:insulinase family protein n=1 Tax=Marinobacter sp. HL-58 TaxID=1479237 RepID=UPI00047FC769|nr:insulinase family protein [Marinobacter sp. HL-58]KPP99471.1 MAG: insulinase-like Zn-dependent peptidase [Marinobacter sp. HL-58]